MFLPSNITLKFGDSGDFVSELQRRLAGVDAYPRDQINGFFNGTTVNGVSAFQTRCGLRADGIAGPETLRRLNTALTGGSSSSDSSSGGGNQDEEQTQAAADVARSFYMLDNQPETLSPPSIEPLHQAEVSGWGAPDSAPEISPDMGAFQPPSQGAALNEQQQIQQQLLREAQMHHQHHAQTHDQLAQTLMQQTQRHQQGTPDAVAAQQTGNLSAEQQQQLHQQQVQQAQATASQPPQGNDALAAQMAAAQGQGTAAMPPKETDVAAQQQMQQAQQQQVQQQMQQQSAEAPPAGAEPTAEPSRGLVGRALGKVDALVQKLTGYFEAKLSPDVLSEVKNIGQVMLRSGVKESAIPSAPDEVRTQSLPSRGPEPMQVPQRG